MSKISKAINEIEYLSEMARKDKWINNIHPLVKLFITVLYIVVVVSFSKYDLLGILMMAIYPICVFNIGDISFKDSLYRLRIVLPVVCVVGVFNPFFDREIVTYVGGLAISAGLLSMLSLMIKGVLTVLASYLLIATTTIDKVCYALRLIHVPKIIVTQVMLIYRYIIVLLAEARRITQAYSLRAPGQKGVEFKAWGSLLGQLLIRSMDRADDLYESMCLRGYKGDYYMEGERFKTMDAIFLVLCMLAFVLVRVFHVYMLFYKP